MVFGSSLKEAAEFLWKKLVFDRYEILNKVHGLWATDKFLKLLSKIRGRSIPENLEREMISPIDTMRDLPSMRTGNRVALALEKDHAHSISHWFTEFGVTPPVMT